ncbi:MAG: M3 family oligoendopeptidase, partial [Clostridia bacterium]|nr:M3 family oligoendopeptidase [Clostridia bacterium]
MDFHTLKYERPDLDHLICAMDSASDRLSSAATADEAFEILQEVNRVRNHAFTMMTIAEIRNSLNTTDSFYETEQDYYDEHLPQI